MHAKSLEIKTRVYCGDSHLSVAHTRGSIAIIYEEQGHYDQALEIYKSALETKIRMCGLMKPKRLKVYARLGLISTKLPIVKDLIEIITHIQMYQNNIKMFLDRHIAIQEGFGVKPKHM